MGPSFRRRLLFADAAFLGLVGTTQVGLQLAGYLREVGPYRVIFERAPFVVIPVIEAMALAVIVAAVLFRAGRRDDTRFGHALGATVHLVLGGVPAVAFESGRALAALLHAEPTIPAGFVIHGAFVLLHAIALSRKAAP